MHNFTQEDLIEYFYNDCSLEKATAIRLILSQDPDVKLQFDEIASVQNELLKMNLSPSENTLKNIVSYAEEKVKQLHTT